MLGKSVVGSRDDAWSRHGASGPELGVCPLRTAPALPLNTPPVARQPTNARASPSRFAQTSSISRSLCSTAYTPFAAPV